jgi:hypothetical protein
MSFLIWKLQTRPDEYFCRGTVYCGLTGEILVREDHKFPYTVRIPVHHRQKGRTTSKPSLKHSFQYLFNAPKKKGMPDSPSSAPLTVANTSSPPPDHPVKEPSRSSQATSISPFLKSDGGLSKQRDREQRVALFEGTSSRPSWHASRSWGT